MTRQLNLILGPPGTGKTTDLIKTTAEHIAAGIRPERIAFVSFTKKAAEEAKTRAMGRFSLPKTAFPHFRTLHSTAYQQLGIRHDQVMARPDYKELAKLLGVEFKGYMDMADGVLLDDTADTMLQLIGLAAATGEPLRHVWSYHDQPLDWFKLRQFEMTLNQYKRDHDKLDFSDMLAEFVKTRFALDVDVAIIDEAQDLSNIQWDLCKVAFRRAKHIYIAGDDDQAIYQWSGANVERLLNLKADSKRVLDKTYRLPATIHQKAENLVKQIERRFAKTWAPTDDRQGAVNYLNAIDQLPVKPGESWMLLARNSYLLNDYAEHCQQVGIPYIMQNKNPIDPEHVQLIILWERLRNDQNVDAEQVNKIKKIFKGRPLPLDKIWHDALTMIPVEQREYYLACLRNGYDLRKPIYIGTIHSVKGGQADNVAIRTDVSYRTQNSFDKYPDSEHRVFYVGITRAKENLFIITPQTNRSYAL